MTMRGRCSKPDWFRYPTGIVAAPAPVVRLSKAVEMGGVIPDADWWAAPATSEVQIDDTFGPGRFLLAVAEGAAQVRACATWVTETEPGWWGLPTETLVWFAFNVTGSQGSDSLAACATQLRDAVNDRHNPARAQLAPVASAWLLHRAAQRDPETVQRERVLLALLDPSFAGAVERASETIRAGVA